MNCQTCQTNLERYLQGNMPEDIKTHIEACETCKSAYSVMQLTEKLVHEESTIQSNPFLATRIMAKIESLDEKALKYEDKPVLVRLLQPVLVAASITLAITIGILAGNSLNQTSSYSEIPMELVYLNDAASESLSFFVNN